MKWLRAYQSLANPGQIVATGWQSHDLRLHLQSTATFFRELCATLAEYHNVGNLQKSDLPPLNVWMLKREKSAKEDDILPIWTNRHTAAALFLAGQRCRNHLPSRGEGDLPPTQQPSLHLQHALDPVA